LHLRALRRGLPEIRSTLAACSIPKPGNPGCRSSPSRISRTQSACSS
jgi:hypothetical protein